MRDGYFVYCGLFPPTLICPRILVLFPASPVSVPRDPYLPVPASRNRRRIVIRRKRISPLFLGPRPAGVGFVQYVHSHLQQCPRQGISARNYRLAGIVGSVAG